MRNLIDMEQKKVSGGDGAGDAPITYPPSQSREDVQTILDQLRHLYDKPGTY